ncbi:hypothetical protein FB446DRAFT_130754 [Lentinula raphanica]|nr:hypothetical protein FB446DRAFT_130754 [Lentinula raphanica]
MYPYPRRVRLLTELTCFRWLHPTKYRPMFEFRFVPSLFLQAQSLSITFIDVLLPRLAFRRKHNLSSLNISQCLSIAPVVQASMAREGKRGARPVLSDAVVRRLPEIFIFFIVILIASKPCTSTINNPCSASLNCSHFVTQNQSSSPADE